MKRTGRLRPRRATPRRRAAPRWTKVEWEDANGLLMARCGGCCEWCGDPLAGRVERHHRQRRRDGGDRLANLVALHPDCHKHITEHPAEATELGFIVSAHCPDVMSEPIHLGCALHSVLLDDEGATTPVDGWGAA